MLNKRGYTRFNLKGSVKFKINRDTLTIISGDLIDISFSGMGVYLKEKLLLGEMAEFELTTEFMGQPLPGKGKVSYIEQRSKQAIAFFKTGIEFTEVPKDELLTLLNRIQAKIADAAKRRWQSGRR
jgi:hypothetical protein